MPPPPARPAVAEHNDTPARRHGAGKRGNGRVGFAEAGARGRSVAFAANGSGLAVREHRTLLAVLSLTAFYSRTEDRVYLAQVAAIAFGVERAEGWHLKRTRESLRVLEDHGLIRTRPPRGRPPAGTAGPAYLIALPELAESDPGSGVHFPEESDPGPGVSFAPESDPDPGPKVTPDPVRKGPRSRSESDPGSRVESDPGSGPPTGKSSGKTPEESVPGRRPDDALDELANAATVDLPSSGLPAGEAIDDSSAPPWNLYEELCTIFDLEEIEDHREAMAIDAWAYDSLHLFPDVLAAIRDELRANPPRELRHVARTVRRVATGEGRIKPEEFPRLDFPGRS
jgi:hypothetical protein